jgi:RimJ/RimL family protein N-acetyltransferase
VLHHGLSTLGLAEIVADIDAENTASIRVAEKLGLRAIERRRGATRVEIRYVVGP